MCADDTPLYSSCLLEDFEYTSDIISGDAVTAETYTSPIQTDDNKQTSTTRS